MKKQNLSTDNKQKIKQKHYEQMLDIQKNKIENLSKKNIKLQKYIDILLRDIIDIGNILIEDL